MTTRIMRAVLVCSFLLASCERSHEMPDAGDAPSTCDATNAGVRLHLTFGFVSESSTPLWVASRNVLHLSFTGGDQFYDFSGTNLDAAHQATVILRYPAAAMAGPATVVFYAIIGTAGNWQAATDFAADPGACTDVDLFVPFVPCCGNDAGVPNDAGP